MTFVKSLKTIASSFAVATLFALGSVTPAIPAQADLDFVQSYVGVWRGSAVLKNSGGADESFRCGITFSQSESTAIKMSGQCSVSSQSSRAVSLSGTMRYVPESNNYRISMSSGLGDFLAQAVARRSGSTLRFNLNHESMNANVAFRNGKFSVTFDVTTEDGAKLTANVPFDRR